MSQSEDYSVLTWREAGEAAKWALADQIVVDLADGLSDRFLAAQSRMSAAKVRSYAQTAQVFPPETRERDLPFELYQICSKTDRPQFWVHWAHAQEASAQELRKAIRAQTPLTVEDWVRRGESLLHQSKKWWRGAPPAAQEQLAFLWKEFEQERSQNYDNHQSRTY